MPDVMCGKMDQTECALLPGGYATIQNTFVSLIISKVDEYSCRAILGLVASEIKRSQLSLGQLCLQLFRVNQELRCFRASLCFACLYLWPSLILIARRYQMFERLSAPSSTLGIEIPLCHEAQ